MTMGHLRTCTGTASGCREVPAGVVVCTLPTGANLAATFQVRNSRAGCPAGSADLGRRSPVGRDQARPFLQACQLVLLLARKQVNQAALHALAMEERAVHLLGDGHLDAESVGH